MLKSLFKDDPDRKTLSISDLNDLTGESDKTSNKKPMIELSADDSGIGNMNLEVTPNNTIDIDNNMDINNMNKVSSPTTTISMDEENEISRLSQNNEMLDTKDNEKSVIDLDSELDLKALIGDKGPKSKLEVLPLKEETKVEVSKKSAKKEKKKHEREAKRQAIAKKQQERRDQQNKRMQEKKELKEKKALAEKKALRDKRQKRQLKENEEKQKKELERLRAAKLAEDAKPYAYEAKVEKVHDPIVPIEKITKKEKQLKEKIKLTEQQIRDNKLHEIAISKKIRENHTKVADISNKIKSLLTENQKLSESIKNENSMNHSNKRKITNFIQKYQNKINQLDNKLIEDQKVITKSKSQEAKLRDVLKVFLNQFGELNKTVLSFKSELENMVIILL